jgi:hypothetical protein
MTIPFDAIEEKLKSVILGTTPTYLYNINLGEKTKFKLFSAVLKDKHDVQWISRVDDHLCIVKLENHDDKMSSFVRYNFNDGTYYVCISIPINFIGNVSLTEVYKVIADVYRAILITVYKVDMPSFYGDYNLAIYTLSARFGIYSLNANFSDYVGNCPYRESIQALIREDVISLDWADLLNILQTRGL